MLLSKPNTKIFFLTVLTFGVASAFVAWNLQSNIAGHKPTKMQEAAATSQGHQKIVDINDPEIIKLREQVKNESENLTAKKNLAHKLIDKLSKEELEPAVWFEVVELLSSVLKSQPKDLETLKDLAEISFNLRAIDKSAEFYQRYLELKPEDLDSRITYASALTLLGKMPIAEQELLAVLKQTPKSFTALANLSITYAEMGKIEDAYKQGDLALENAPSPEAKQRFTKFLVDLKSKQTSVQNKSDSTAITDPTQIIVDSIKQNPVAGPKFISESFDPKEGILKLTFKDFPMQAMPDFAKKKFISGIEAYWDKTKIKSIIFVDQATGEQMYQVP